MRLSSIKYTILSGFLVMAFYLLSATNNLVLANPSPIVGKAYMMHNNQPFPLKDVTIEKNWRCTKLPLDCHGDQSPYPFYTLNDGRYLMVEFGAFTTAIDKQGRHVTSCDDANRGACGLNCGENGHQIRAYFPSNYDKNNFPAGIDYSKGHWLVRMSEEVTRMDGSTALTDGSGNQIWYGNPANDSGYDGLNFEWVPDSLPISGVVVNSQTNQGLSGVSVEVSNDKGVRLPATTDNSGRFSVPSTELFKNSNRYAVRITSIPIGFRPQSQTVTTTNWSYNIVLKRDQLLTDPSYEQQQPAADDCAGPEKNPAVFPHQIGRCNFKVDPVLPTTTPTPTISATLTPTGVVNPTLTPTRPVTTGTITTTPTINSPTSTPTPTNTIACDLIPTTGARVSGIKIDTQSVDISTFSSIKITLSGSSATIPLNVNYSNGACRVFSFKLNYAVSISPTSTPTPTINQALCTPATNRPNQCGCTNNDQCQSGLCNLTVGGVCQTPAHIQTSGGDVHTNEQLKGPGQ